MFYCRRIIRDTFIRSERPGEAVQLQPLRPQKGEELKGGINFLPPASTAQSPITSLVSSDPGFSVFIIALHLASCTVTTALSPTASFPPLQSPAIPMPSPCPQHKQAPQIS